MSISKNESHVEAHMNNSNWNLIINYGYYISTICIISTISIIWYNSHDRLVSGPFQSRTRPQRSQITTLWINRTTLGHHNGDWLVNASALSRNLILLTVDFGFLAIFVCLRLMIGTTPGFGQLPYSI